VASWAACWDSPSSACSYGSSRYDRLARSVRQRTASTKTTIPHCCLASNHQRPAHMDSTRWTSGRVRSRGPLCRKISFLANREHRAAPKSPRSRFTQLRLVPSGAARHAASRQTTGSRGSGSGKPVIACVRLLALIVSRWPQFHATRRAFVCARCCSTPFPGTFRGCATNDVHCCPRRTRLHSAGKG
jgi:hypothetical protein